MTPPRRSSARRLAGATLGARYTIGAESTRCPALSAAAKPLIAAALVVLVMASCGGPSTGRPLVFAAASLEDSLIEIGAGFEAAGGVRPTFNFAATNVLAAQIVAASGPDLFFAADSEWMDHVEERGRLLEDSRRPFLTNRLVVIGHESSRVHLNGLADIAGADFEYLAIADPAAVPAGRYARALLERVSAGGGTLWEHLEGRLAPAADVRAALGLVEAEPRFVGIVYATEAATSDAVRVLLEAPANLTPPIRYEVAAIGLGDAPAAARLFLEYATGAVGREVFARHGFTPLADESNRTDG